MVYFLFPISKDYRGLTWVLAQGFTKRTGQGKKNPFARRLREAFVSSSVALAADLATSLGRRSSGHTSSNTSFQNLQTPASRMFRMKTSKITKSMRKMPTTAEKCNLWHRRVLTAAGLGPCNNAHHDRIHNKCIHASIQNNMQSDHYND